MPLAITSAPSSVQAGGIAVVKGTCGSCDQTVPTVTFNGSTLGSPPVTWSCSNGNWTLKISPAPPCVPGQPNVIEVQVTEGGSSVNCDIQVNC